MQIIRELIDKCLAELELPVVEFSVDHPKDEKNGDYSVNVAMILAKKLGKNPREVASQIVTKLHGDTVTQIIDKVEVAEPGFINFYLTKEYLLAEMQKASDPGFGKNTRLVGQKTYVEYTDPNPFKEFHIGHLMSNTIGESLARILEANGAEVKRANYQGDVGLHVAKSVWGMGKQLADSGIQLTDLAHKGLQERQKMMGQAYAYGATQYESSESAKAEINTLNKEIYQGLDLPGVARKDARKDGVMEMYHLGREWSLEYFETIYQRLGTKFDEYFFESEEGPKGLIIVEEGLQKGVLELGEGGAVVFKGEQFGLHTRVFRNKLGLPTYEAKELALPISKYERWPYDKSFIITANEINEYFKVLLKVLSLLYPELASKTTHLSHGMMKLTTGKMSSRTGVVVTGEGLLNELKEVVIKKIGERKIKDPELVADQVAVASLKYSVLKQAIGGDIVYEPEKMTNLEGDTGPYIQYTYVRARSVIGKSASLQVGESASLLVGGVDNPETMSILRWLYRYPEVVTEAGERYAPHLVAGYTYELATRFNSFYNAHQIGDDPGRLELTRAVASVLESGLRLLGIVAPAEM